MRGPILEKHSFPGLKVVVHAGRPSTLRAQMLSGSHQRHPLLASGTSLQDQPACQAAADVLVHAQAQRFLMQANIITARELFNDTATLTQLKAESYDLLLRDTVRCFCACCSASRLTAADGALAAGLPSCCSRCSRSRPLSCTQSRWFSPFLKWCFECPALWYPPCSLLLLCLCVFPSYVCFCTGLSTTATAWQAARGALLPACLLMHSLQAANAVVLLQTMWDRWENLRMRGQYGKLIAGKHLGDMEMLAREVGLWPLDPAYRWGAAVIVSGEARKLLLLWANTEEERLSSLPCAASWALQQPFPVPPRVQVVGPILASDAVNPLPAELATFLDSGLPDHGGILVSMVRAYELEQLECWLL